MGKKEKRVRAEWGHLSARGEKYYLKYYDEHGKRRMRLAGTTTKEAHAFRARKKREVARARARAHAVGAVTDVKLADWWDDEYGLVLASRLKTSGLRTAQVHVQRLVTWLEGREDPPMADVTRRDAEAFVASLFGEGKKPAYVRRLVSTLSRAWQDALVRNLATTNPFAKMKIAQPAPTEVPWVTPEQLVELYAATPASARDAITIAGETGLRVGEIQALRRRDVDLCGPTPRLHVRDGKTASSRRTVPLTPRATRVLERILEEEGEDADPVLPRRTSQWYRTALETACKAVGIKRLTTHKLRHVYASHLVQANVPPSTVARLLGHADGGQLVTKLYGRWMPHDAESRAVSALASWRGGAPPGTAQEASPPPPASG